MPFLGNFVLVLHNTGAFQGLHQQCNRIASQEDNDEMHMVAAVRDCNGQESFAGRFYQDMYAELSGKIHYPRWTGPEILVDGD